MNKKIGIIVGIIIVLMLAGFGVYKFKGESTKQTQVEKTVKIVDRKGEKEVPLKPERVVVLDLGSLDIMTELGVEPVGLPKNSLPSYLEKYKDSKYADLGALKEFNMEKINELKPDLIIIEGRQESSYDELAKIAPVVFLGTKDGDHFGSLKTNVEVLGAIFDKKDVAEDKLKAIDKRVEELNKKVKETNKTALVAMVSDSKISVFGQGSRFRMIYDKFGFAPADDKIEVSGHGQDVSYEYLKAKNPGYLFVVDRGAVVGGNQKPAKEVIENELVKTTEAYKEGNIVYLNPQAWYIGGSGLMSTDVMLTEIENSLK
jgi:iron complex transport system substrate-binding protein